jgi:hypothetical protein
MEERRFISADLLAGAVLLALGLTLTNQPVRAETAQVLPRESRVEPDGLCLTGHATDSTGAALPGADVRLRARDNGNEHATATNSDGRFRFTNLDAGVYSLSAALEGFRTERRDGIILRDNCVDVGGVALTVGSLSETITLTSGLSSVAEDTEPFAGPWIPGAVLEDLPKTSASADAVGSRGRWDSRALAAHPVSGNAMTPTLVAPPARRPSTTGPWEEFAILPARARFPSRRSRDRPTRDPFGRSRTPDTPRRHDAKPGRC